MGDEQALRQAVEWAATVHSQMVGVGADKWRAEKKLNRYRYRAEMKHHEDTVEVEVYDPSVQMDSTIRKVEVPVFALEKVLG